MYIYPKKYSVKNAISVCVYLWHFFLMIKYFRFHDKISSDIDYNICCVQINRKKNLSVRAPMLYISSDKMLATFQICSQQKGGTLGCPLVIVYARANVISRVRRVARAKVTKDGKGKATALNCKIVSRINNERKVCFEEMY